MRRRRGAGAAIAALSLVPLLLRPPSLVAQDTTRAVSRDTTQRPAPPRSAPVLDPDVPAVPLPPGARYTFTNDSVLWSSAMSLADLLAAVPGVYLTRVGFLGQPEYVAFAGRGAAALELYRDGVPVTPLGGDSVFIDPSRIPLTTLERVDVEVLPAQLRVYLVSERHDTPDTRSLVGITSGDFGTGQYTGLFQKRWPGGLGLNLGADYFATNGAVNSGRSDQAFEVWGRAEWVPTPTAGAMYQIRRQNDDHDAVAGLSEPVGTPARAGSRTDVTLRVFAAARPDRRGFSGAFDLASQSWTADSSDTTVSDRTVRMMVTRGRYVSARATGELMARLSDGPVRQALEGRLGLVPIPGIVLSGDARLTGYGDGRSGRRAHGSAGLYRGPFSFVGEASYGLEPQAPAVVADTARRTLDRGARVGFTTRPLSVRAGIVERGAYDPLPFTDLRLVPAASPAPRSTYYVSDVRFQPIRPLTFEAWYAHPAEGGADFQPPHHGRTAITFRSKFWRTFRSGAFDLKVRIAIESWSAGVAGRTAGGGAIPLGGLTFTEVFLAFQIVGFTAFWDLRNAWNTLDGYVPGYQRYPRNAQTFGVRWEFKN